MRTGKIRIDLNRFLEFGLGFFVSLEMIQKNPQVIVSSGMLRINAYRFAVGFFRLIPSPLVSKNIP